MDSELLAKLRARCPALVEDWHEALARLCYSPMGISELRANLRDLADRIVSLVAAEPLEPLPALRIGGALVDLHLLQPEVLGRTQQVLARHLLEGLTADEVSVLGPRVARLLSEIATGYVQSACCVILEQQEQTLAALLADLRAQEQALRQARDELELRVQKRTAELARASAENRELYEAARLQLEERQRAEAALRESEARWRSLVQNAPDLILIIDRDLRIQFINRVQPIWGVAPEELVGASALDYVVPEQREAAAAAINRAFETGEPSHYVTAAMKPTGQIVWFANHVAPVSASGDTSTLIMVSRDITGQRQLEQMKHDLVQEISHELRTPLTKLQVSLDLLADGITADRLDRAVALQAMTLARANTRHLHNTVEGILELSALEAGARKLVVEPLDLGELIRHAVQQVELLARSRNLVVRAELPEALPGVPGDRRQLSWVLNNLLDNALKFSDQGEVVVRAQAGDDGVEVSVTDQGRGISEENLERIFDRFFQECPSDPGMGVGLSICRAVVNGHGGRFWAESGGQGQGATLRFTLPAQRPPESQPEMQAWGA